MQRKTLSSAVFGLVMGADVFAEDLSVRLDACAAMVDDSVRLSCYDHLVHREPRGVQKQDLVPDSPTVSTLSHGTRNNAEKSILSEQWELDPADKKGRFNFRAHRENYIIATYNPSPNIAPYRPLLPPNHTGALSKAELKFQIGFKLKVAENPGKLPVDLWFGYTQTSFWQADNRQASSPFRETDYQPEIMAVVPLDIDLGGLKLRFLNVGFLHESNGQSSLLSRSWNRSYIQAGFERGNFTLLTRAWKRFKESADEDDNHDIVEYMGRGDVLGTWRLGGHKVSLLARHNFGSNKGAYQADWAFPIARRLSGYLQYFSGYGHSLIDYNGYQRVFGLGVSVSY